MPRSLLVRALVPLATLALAAGCDADGGGVVCTDSYRYGLAVYVRDSVTNAPIASGTTAIATDGAYRDSVTAPDPWAAGDAAPLGLAGERAGTYSLSVRRPGYLPRLYSGLQVTKDACHVHTVTVNALLQPAP